MPAPNRGYSANHGKSWLAPECVVADAVLVEPVSTHEFPANREINREFCRIRILKADTRANSKASSEIPYAGEQGIISAEQGILVWEQGIFRGHSRNHHRMKFFWYTQAPDERRSKVKFHI
jgi:hypothetical protein